MRFLFLLLTMVVMSLQNICVKQNRVRNSDSNPLKFSAISAISAMMFFCVTSKFDLNFRRTIFPYSLSFGLAYACAIAGLNFAISTGSLAISSLIHSYALIIPTMYGILIIKEPVGMPVYIGIFLLLFSLFLINGKGDAKRFSLKWIAFIVIAFLGNGLCSTIQKMQQLRFEGAYKNEFMVVSLGSSAVILSAITLFVKKDNMSNMQECCKYAFCAGIANGFTNLAIMILSAVIPNAILFPTLSAGGIVIMFFVSLLLYKEKMSMLQKIGFVTGVISVIFLNL